MTLTERIIEHAASLFDELIESLLLGRIRKVTARAIEEDQVEFVDRLRLEVVELRCPR